MAKSDNINIRVTATERAEIVRRASEAGMTLTSYIVAAALGHRSDPPDPPPLDRIEATLAEILARLDQLAGHGD
jgi:hypothetical protein